MAACLSGPGPAAGPGLGRVQVVGSVPPGKGEGGGRDAPLLEADLGTVRADPVEGFDEFGLQGLVCGAELRDQGIGGLLVPEPG